nr:unnamed protein product [Callosobruchus analis]
MLYPTSRPLLLLLTFYNFHNQNLLERPLAKLPDFDLPRREYCTLNLIRTNHGRCNKSKYLCGWPGNAQYNYCGATEQSINHLVSECPSKMYSGPLDDIYCLIKEGANWLRATDLELYSKETVRVLVGLHIKQTSVAHKINNILVCLEYEETAWCRQHPEYPILIQHSFKISVNTNPVVQG